MPSSKEAAAAAAVVADTERAKAAPEVKGRGGKGRGRGVRGEVDRILAAAAGMKVRVNGGERCTLLT